MDLEYEVTSLRIELNSRQRTANMRLAVDPGFVHYRKMQTLLGPRGMGIIDEAIANLPDLPRWMRQVRVDHIYAQVLIDFCDVMHVPTLGDILASSKGRLFCSTENLEPSSNVYKAERAISRISVPGVTTPRAELHYSTSRITSDTTRMELHNGGLMSVVADLREYRDNTLVFQPLLMGAPWLASEEDVEPFAGPEWWSYSYFENFIEDIREFSRVSDVPEPKDFSVMNDISESAFKQCLTEILGDEARKDWGGETSDHFTAHLHLGKRRVTAAFLLKGPARFAPMDLNHLGKNNDQIYRLAQEPAQLLVVQHCHEILSAVRATLRAFAVRPGSTRRYCLIDGRDSLRLLMAYGKLDRALELSSSK
jgi:hypothetical protein